MAIHDYNISSYILTPPSINGERCRWALDHYGIAYNDHQLTLTPAAFMVAKKYASKAEGSKYVYIIDNKNQQVFRLMEPLIDWLDPQMSESKRLKASIQAEHAEAFQAAMTIFNQYVRVWSYNVLGPRRALFAKIMTHGVPTGSRLFFISLSPLLSLLTRFISSADKQKEQLVLFRQAFDHSDTLFADGREFVSGKAFSRLDLDLACNIAPLIMPPEYGYDGGVFPPLSDRYPTLKAVVEEFRQRPTGQYVLNVYRNHRHPA